VNRNIKIIGGSSQIRNLIEFIKKASKIDVNVLVLGETGVGKELAARMIHIYSARKDKPFIKINCSNINENLLESELFGYKKGAYTGAIIDKPGLLEAANGGTFFLDEIADINLYLQAKFLSFIEDKELRRLGENRTRKIDVRFIFASNKDINKFIKQAKFRDDLYYRISVLSFYIAPLRERKEDIHLLIKSYLKNKSLKQSQYFTIEQTAIDKLMRYSFPGNVRELQNIMERATVLSENRKISEKDIIFYNMENSGKKEKLKSNREIIKKTVEKYQGNKTKAALALGVSRQWIHKVLNESDRK